MYIHLAFVWRCSTRKKRKNERSRALPTSSVPTWAKYTYLGLVGCRLPAMESTPEANRSASSPPPYLVTQSYVIPIEFNLAGDLFARGPCRCPSAVARRPPQHPSPVALSCRFAVAWVIWHRDAAIWAKFSHSTCRRRCGSAAPEQLHAIIRWSLISSR
jgi:hypothetical protein